MGTGYRPAANLPSDEDGTNSPSVDGYDDDQRSLADVLDGVFTEVDVDSVEAVREIRRDE